MKRLYTYLAHLSMWPETHVQVTSSEGQETKPEEPGGFSRPRIFSSPLPFPFKTHGPPRVLPKQQPPPLPPGSAGPGEVLPSAEPWGPPRQWLLLEGSFLPWQIVSRRAKSQVGGRLKDAAAGLEWCDFIQESEGAAGGQEQRQEGRVWAGWEAASAGLVCWPDDAEMNQPQAGRV